MFILLMLGLLDYVGGDIFYVFSVELIFLGIFMPLVFILVSITHLCLLLLVMVCELAYTKQLN